MLNLNAILIAQKNYTSHPIDTSHTTSIVSSSSATTSNTPPHNNTRQTINRCHSKPDWVDKPFTYLYTGSSIHWNLWKWNCGHTTKQKLGLELEPMANCMGPTLSSHDSIIFKNFWSQPKTITYSVQLQKKHFPLHAWLSLVHKTQIRSNLPSRSKIHYICSLLPIK